LNRVPFPNFEFGKFGFPNKKFGKGAPFKIGWTLCADISLRTGKYFRNRIYGRSLNLNKTQFAGLQGEGHTLTILLNCALTFIHVSKLFSFWNWKESKLNLKEIPSYSLPL